MTKDCDWTTNLGWWRCVTTKSTIVLQKTAIVFQQNQQHRLGSRVYSGGFQQSCSWFGHVMTHFLSGYPRGNRHTCQTCHVWPWSRSSSLLQRKQKWNRHIKHCIYIYIYMHIYAYSQQVLKEVATIWIYLFDMLFSFALQKDIVPTKNYPGLWALPPYALWQSPGTRRCTACLAEDEP